MEEQKKNIMRLTLLCLLFLAGCTTARKVENYYRDHEDERAKMCAEKFPVRDSIVTKYDTVKANNANYQTAIDSLASEIEQLRLIGETGCDTVAAKTLRETIKTLQTKVKDLQNKYTPCKPDTVIKQVTIYKENTASVDFYKGETTKYKALYEAERLKAKNRLIWFIVACALLVIGIILKIKKVI